MGEVVVKTKDEKGQEVELKLDDAAVGKLVGEKSELAGKLAAAEGRAAKLKVVEEFAGKLGISPEDLVANADGAFTLVSKLIEDGLIDPKGNVLAKKEPKGKGGEPAPEKKEGELDLDALLKGDSKGLTGDAKLAAIVMKALEPTLKPLAKTIDEITTVQTGMLRDRWEERILKEYPTLGKDDVRRVFSDAARRPKDGILDIAKEHSEAKSKSVAELRAAHAKEFGVNLEEFDANKLKEKGSEGGAGVMAQGKKFTLSSRRAAQGKPGEFADPSAATREYFKKQGLIR